jgi:N-acetylmuramoyl-L-alanine amidase
MPAPIHSNDSGESVRIHQQHLNDRLRAHGDPPIRVDGDCGPETIEASARAAFFLGAMESTVRKVQRGEIAGGVVAMIADPRSRNAEQKQRARERHGTDLPARNGTLHIVTAEEWGAVAPVRPIARVGRPDKIVFHHTDGHAPGPTLADAKAYARSIQHDHMHRSPPFIDSGHNFLVTRSGFILEGRHGSLAAIEAGVMVNSAHAPGANHHPGIEHEHKGTEGMTAEQRAASLDLHEFICRKTGIHADQVLPHRMFTGTECPGVLGTGLPQFRTDLKTRLAA